MRTVSTGLPRDDWVRADAIRLSSTPYSTEVPPARRFHGSRPMHTATFSSSPAASASLYMWARWRGTIRGAPGTGGGVDQGFAPAGPPGGFGRNAGRVGAGGKCGVAPRSLLPDPATVTASRPIGSSKVWIPMKTPPAVLEVRIERLR